MKRVRQVHNFLKPVQIRFRVQPFIVSRASNIKNNNPNNALPKQRNKSMQVVSQKPMQKQQGVQIKHIIKLIDQLYIVGDLHKLMLLGVFSNDGQIQTQKLLDFYVEFEIADICFEKQKNHLIIRGSRQLIMYNLDLKKIILSGPSSLLKTNNNILFMHVYNEIYLAVFFADSCSLYNIEGNQIISCQTYPYVVTNRYIKLLCVPSKIGKYINLFFFDESQYNQKEDTLFGLYKCQLYLDNGEFYLSPMIKIYELQSHHKKRMIIQNYDKETILINLRQEILVLKKHYPIDTGMLNYKHQHSFLKYIENQTLLHICEDRIDAHTLEVFKNSISIKCYDTLDFIKPKDSVFIDCFLLSNFNIIMFYGCKNNRSFTETKLWITTTVPVSIKTKLHQILKERNEERKGQPLTLSDLKDVQEKAEKMALTKRQIFLELWHQSRRKEKADYDILLETQDYKTICKQIKKCLKKESIKFTQIQRIQKACFNMLSKQIAKNPTETNLRHYLKSHMMLRKYSIERMLQYQRKQILDLFIKQKEIEEQQAKQLQSRHFKKSIKHQKQKEETRRQIKEVDRGFELSVQQYTTIRRRNIKTFMIKLLKSRDEQSIRILKQFINCFRMVLRVIFTQFITDILKQTKQEFYQVLVAYPELLPLPRLNNSKYDFHSEKCGIWSDITSNDWQKNEYYEKLRNIDNVQLIQNIIKSDKFRWDFLVRHDFTTITKNQFSKAFVTYRNFEVYYVVIEALFKIIPNKQQHTKIVNIIQQTYPIPEHLQDRVMLYWELYNFLIAENRLPGYELTFKQLLQLKEQQIYRFIFTNQINCKGLVLNGMKQIYDRLYKNTECSEFFNDSIRQYFMQPYSSISDLKYLLNRINNQKVQFHQENLNLYTVLVDAIYYKLELSHGQEIPINEIIIYFQNIPLLDEDIFRLKRIEEVLRYSDIFSRVLLNMNLKYFFDHPLEVITGLTEFYMGVEGISISDIYEVSSENGLSFMGVVDLLREIRQNLFNETVTETQILRSVISYCMNFEDVILELQDVIYEEKLLEKFNIDIQPFLEQIVELKIVEAFESKPIFNEHETYIRNLIGLLHGSSPKKQAMEVHLKLGLMLSILKNPPKAPLQNSTRFIANILNNEPVNIVKQLDFDKIYEYLHCMGMEEDKNMLYEVLIEKYLKEAEWQEAIKYTKIWNMNDKRILFSAKVIMKLGEQLPKEYRRKLVNIIFIFYTKNDELLAYANQIIQTKESRERKSMIDQALFDGNFFLQDYYENNWLLSPQLKQITYPHNMKRVVQFFDTQIRPLEIEFQKSETYYFYFLLLLTDPVAAYQFQRKSIKVIKFERIQSIISNLLSSNFFNPVQLLLFNYTTLVFIFLSLYASKQFTEEVQVKLLKEDFSVTSQIFNPHIAQLEQDLVKQGQGEKYQILKNARRMYLRRKRNVDNNDNLSMEVESDQEQKLAELSLKFTRANSKMQENKNPRRLISRKLSSLHKFEVGTQNQMIRSSQVMEESPRKLDSPKNSIRNSMRHDLFARTQQHARNEKQTFTDMLRSQKIEFVHITTQQISGLDSRLSINLKESNMNKVESERISNQQQELIIVENKENLDEALEQIMQVTQTQQVTLSPFKPINRELYYDSNHRHPDLPDIHQISKEESRMEQDSNAIIEQVHKQDLLPESIRRPIRHNTLNLKTSETQQMRRLVSELKKQLNSPSDLKKPPLIFRQSEQPSSIKKSTSESYQDLLQPQLEENPNSKSDIKTTDLNTIQQNFENSVISLKNQLNYEQLQMLHSKSIEQQVSTICALATNKEYHKIQQYLSEINAKDGQILKGVVNRLYETLSFERIIETVQNLTKMNQHFDAAIKPHNLKVMRCAMRAGISFDLRLIFPPQILFLQTSENSEDIQANNKIIFQYLKPRIKTLLTELNVWTISKVMYFCFNYNKSFEYRVQYYYLQNLIKNFVSHTVLEEESGRIFQKIFVLIKKLPVQMTLQRFQNILKRVTADQYNKSELTKVLQEFSSFIQSYKDQSKYLSEIAHCETALKSYLQ